jgi:hypothetical protein
MCFDIYSKYHKDWLSHSKINRGKTFRHTDTHTHRQESDLIILLSFSQNKESRLTSIVYLKIINGLISVLETKYVSCEVRTEFLNVI